MYLCDCVCVYVHPHVPLVCVSICTSSMYVYMYLHMCVYTYLVDHPKLPQDSELVVSESLHDSLKERERERERECRVDGMEVRECEVSLEVVQG